YGLELTTVVAGLERVTCLPRRMERIEYGQNFGAFVDCARSADALAHCLEALRAVTPGRLICVLGPESTWSDDHVARAASVCRQNADTVILTSGPTGVASGRGLRQMEREFDSDDAPAIEVERARAIGRALSLAREGDTVLIAGSADIAEQQRAGVMQPLDDREVVSHWLYEELSPLRQAA
ncbi:MAG: hypothetical protein MI757_02390, partial [Pirellulales bacterium]|nr:hypothetical protein [Pirellulales bacterium]